MSRIVTKPTQWHVRPAKTQVSLGIRPVWSESSLSAWRKLRSLATHWADSEESDQTGRMPRLIRVFAGRTCHFVCFCHDAAQIERCILRSDTKHVRRMVPSYKWAATWQNQWGDCAPSDLFVLRLNVPVNNFSVMSGRNAPSEDSDQPGHPPSLIRVFAVRLKGR